MFFRMIYDEGLAQAAYLIGCPDSGRAIVIDPERDVDRYIELAAAHKLEIVAVADTHIHSDYVSGARELADRVGAHVYASMHGGDDWTPRWIGTARGGHTLVGDGDSFEIGAARFEVVHTPGHTPEHICFLVTDGKNSADPIGMLSGDFVFVGDVGRPDLLETAAGYVGVKEASAADLHASIGRLKLFDDFLQIWPGHGAGSACGKNLGDIPQSTLGYERRTNPAFDAAGDEERFVGWVLTDQPEPPVYFARMKQVNRDGPEVLGGLPTPEPWTSERLESFAELGGIVVDCRAWDQFRAGHLPGSLSIPIDEIFSTVAGSFIEADAEIALVADAPTCEAALRGLIRVGLDRIVGVVDPASFAVGSASVDVLDHDGVRSAGRDAFLLDVRRATEHREGHLPGTTNIAYAVLKKHAGGLPRDRRVIVTCRTGRRSARATAFLRRLGIDAVNHGGGIQGWVDAGMPVEH